MTIKNRLCKKEKGSELVLGDRLCVLGNRSRAQGERYILFKIALGCGHFKRPTGTARRVGDVLELGQPEGGDLLPPLLEELVCSS